MPSPAVLRCVMALLPATALLTFVVGPDANRAAEPHQVTQSAAADRKPWDDAVAQAFPPVRSAERGSVRLARAQSGPAEYLVLSVEFHTADACRDFKVEGAHVITRFDRFADMFVASKAAVQGVIKAPGFRWLDFAGVTIAPPPRPGERERERARAAEPIVRGGLDGLTGKGVVIALLDSGIDFRHPDFIRPDADGKPTSRVLAFWDTLSDPHASRVGQPAPYRYPTGAAIGTVYCQAELTAELRAAEPKIAAWDTDGHGTACAGIAAGNGTASKDKEHQGVAPDADLIVVRLGHGPDLENSYLLGAACEWVLKVADGRPVVVSCSFGMGRGGRDGSRVEERQLDARFPLDAKGRAICVAGGNEGEELLHAEAEFRDSATPAVLRWVSVGFGQLEIYFDTADLADLRFKGLDAVRAKEATYLHDLTGKLFTEIKVPPGRGELVVHNISGKAMRLDAYVGPAAGAEFDPSCAKPGKQIATPGTAHRPITVGSYDWNSQFHQYGAVHDRNARMRDGRLVPLRLGALSAYSNSGPSRAPNVVKPEIVAPGQYFTAPAARNTRAERDSTGHYQIFNGTSAATPYTAGVVALLMQKKPTITFGEIKGLLKDHASSDLHTDAVPNPRWGHGKLDVKAVDAMLKALR